MYANSSDFWALPPIHPVAGSFVCCPTILIAGFTESQRHDLSELYRYALEQARERLRVASPWPVSFSNN